MYQSRFSRLGQAAVPGSSSSAFLGAARDSSGGAAIWALELLGIMLVVGLVGFVRAMPLTLARVGACVALGKRAVVTELPLHAAGPTRSDTEHETEQQDQIAA